MYVGVAFICFLTLSCQPSDGLTQSEMEQCGVEEEGKKPGPGELILYRNGPLEYSHQQSTENMRKSSLGYKGYKPWMEQGQGVVSILVVLSDSLPRRRARVSSHKDRGRVPPQRQRKGSRQGLGRD